MIVQHLLDENTCKNLDTSIDNKIKTSILRLLRQYNWCFTDPEQKFLNNKHHEVNT